MWSVSILISLLLPILLPTYNEIRPICRCSLLISVFAQEVVGRGRSCAVWRQDLRNITRTQICEGGLTCQGFGPREVRDSTGSAHHIDFNVYRGICVSANDIQLS
ncbi:uncharacterized protein BYT42DRAFT_623406 [Radiomyces spectabilis]|uniref:uncharacterized protein n=1 Tax=Radiomyces spectabilis TaxID=64574 RepID=UPI00221EDB4D|nr:uncharacterized protein BYT42DRAFT_623406 [Radiomyces spectabilis]KAI8370521.1 hypothetical protein BYT42DRAFT_623406 [Radiomyces spectabilis]